MGKYVIRDPWVEINSIDLSSLVAEVAVNTSAADVEVTSGGADGIERQQGLRDDSYEFTFRQDFDAAKVDATLWPLFDAGTEFEVRVAKTALLSATNPSFDGNVIITEYSPIAGSIGDAGDAQLTMPVSGKISRSVC